MLGGATGSLFAPWSSRCGVKRRRQRCKNWIEMLDDLRFPADHLAKPALEAPDAAARAGIHVMKSLGLERLGAAQVVNVVGVAAVHHDVAALEATRETVESLLDDGRRHHHPCNPRFV